MRDRVAYACSAVAAPARSCLTALGVIAVAALVWYAASERGGATSPLSGGESESVMVVIVRDEATLDAVRAVVSRDRIVAEEPSGFALREGRIVASSHDAVGGLITRAGWTQGRLEIVTPGSLSAPRAATGRSSGDGELNALFSKRTLSPAEARRALELLE